MQVAILIEPDRSNGYRAIAPTYPDITAEAPTEEAAVKILRERLSERLQQARVTSVEIPVRSDKPWMAAAGCLKDEPDQEAYREAMLEYRRQVDADPTR